MSIFGTIMSKIFHQADAAPAGGDASPQPSAGAAPENGGPTTPDPVAPTQVASNDEQPAAAAPSTPAPAATASPTPAPAAPPSAPVDVAAVLDGLAAKSSQHLDWKHSIVDMMKLLDMDSSLTARKTLAGELHYTGDTGDSASMNIWLHKAVMQKLAENGGAAPADLKG